MSESKLNPMFSRAEQLGVRLEIVGGLPVWEPYPIYKHQKAVDRIRATIAPAASAAGDERTCACIHAADIYIGFPDGSLKRPDIAIFCHEPEEEEEAVRLVPEAVIEVVSRGYEVKDTELAPPFYLVARGERHRGFQSIYDGSHTHSARRYDAAHVARRTGVFMRLSLHGIRQQ
jgi:hypothetical protein